MRATLVLKRHARSVLALFVNLLTVSVLVWMVNTPALAQTDTFIAGSGLWSKPGNWSLNQVPGRSNDCVIPANSVVTSDLAGECLNFTLGGGGKVTVTPGYLFIYGLSFINQGTINVGAGNGLDVLSDPGMTTTLSGGGTINLTDPNDRMGGNSNTLLNVDNAIHGQGNLGVGSMQITNQSLIDANVGTLILDTTGVTNTATIQASNGGTLLLEPPGLGYPFNNTGGTIQALNGSTVQVTSYTITGGTLTTVGTGVFQEINTAVLNNLTNNGNYQLINGNVTALQGTVINNGTFQALQGGLKVSGNATLKGTGTVMGGTGQLIGSYTVPATLLNQTTVQGGGTIGDNNLTITNQGTVNANDVSSPLVIAGPNSLTNTATLEASSGATLQIENTVNNTGGTIEALTGSTVLLAAGTVNGGTLTTSGSGTFQTMSGTLDGTVNIPTNAGLFKVANSNTLMLKGTINNTGTIALDKTGGSLGLQASTTLAGKGKVTMAGTANSIFAFCQNCVFTNQSTIQGGGSIGDSNPMGIVNQQSIIANSTAPLTIVPNGSGFTNNGTLTINKGSTLSINGVFNNFSGTTLTGGTYVVSGTFMFNNAAIGTSAASITLSGTAAKIVDQGMHNALANFATNSASGSFTVQGGNMTTTATNLTNAGILTVAAGSGLSVGGSYTQTAGTTTVDGALNTSTGATLSGGQLFGKGMLGNSLQNGAAVTPGDSPTKTGKLCVSGAYTQTSSGALNISIGGLTLGTQYDQLAVSNGINLSGTLNIKRIKNFVPAIGNSFTILTGTVVSGTFSTVVGTSINSKEHFKVIYNSNNVELTVEAGP